MPRFPRTYTPHERTPAAAALPSAAAREPQLVDSFDDRHGTHKRSLSASFSNSRSITLEIDSDACAQSGSDFAAYQSIPCCLPPDVSLEIA